MNAIYVMQAGTGPVKIGVSRAPDRRVDEVAAWHRWGVQGDIVLRHSVAVPDGLSARRVEHLAHTIVAAYRLQGEWFNISHDEALAAVQRAIELRGEVLPDVRKIVSMPAELVERIKRFRFAKEINTEAEAIRALIEKGLEAEGVK